MFARNTGPAISPFNAWIISKSLETLAVRMERHYENALKLGYTKPITEIYKTAGIQFNFSESYIKELIDFVKQEMGKI